MGFKDDIPMRGGFIYRELTRIPLCCVLPVDHPWSQKEEINENELLTENMIVCNSFEMPSKAANIQNHLENKFLPDSAYYCENLQVMLSLVKAGYGFAILPDKASEDTELAFVRLSGYPPISYGLFYKRSSKNPLVKKFISIAQSQDSDS